MVVPITRLSWIIGQRAFFVRLLLGQIWAKARPNSPLKIPPKIYCLLRLFLFPFTNLHFPHIDSSILRITPGSPKTNFHVVVVIIDADGTKEAVVLCYGHLWKHIFLVSWIWWQLGAIYYLSIGLPPFNKRPHQHHKSFQFDVWVSQNRICPEGSFSCCPLAGRTLPVEEVQGVLLVVTGDHSVTGLADALIGQDHHLLKQQDGWSQTDHFLGENPFTGLEEPHPSLPEIQLWLRLQKEA